MEKKEIVSWAESEFANENCSIISDFWKKWRLKCVFHRNFLWKFVTGKPDVQETFFEKGFKLKSEHCILK